MATWEGRSCARSHAAGTPDRFHAIWTDAPTRMDLLLRRSRLSYPAPSGRGRSCCHPNVIRVIDQLRLITVISARDLAVIEHKVAQGVVPYLIKPFTPGARSKLDAYAVCGRSVVASDATTPRPKATWTRCSRCDRALVSGTRSS